MEGIGYHICQTARYIYQGLFDVFEKYDITPEQWVVLKYLLTCDGISQKELSLAVNKDQNTTKAIVDKLVRKGYVDRICNPRDKRAFSLFPTSRAKDIAPTLARLDSEFIEILQKDFSRDDLEFIFLALEKIKKNICKKVYPQMI